MKHDKCHHNKKKVLFILKKRNNYGINIVSYGLKNSCSFVAKDLENHDIDCKIVEVIDTTFIDREVHKFKPDYVIIEAIWAEPQRLPILFKLHPYVKKWSVRLHSKTGFIQNEGNAIEYIRAYQDISINYPKFNVSVNHLEMQKELFYGLAIYCDLLPNIYPFEETNYIKDKHPEIFDIGAFGSLRPMKNFLIQAMAAIEFANKHGKLLRFHINSDRHEQNGQNVLKNIRSLFKDGEHHLIEHNWANHHDFVDIIKRMDIGMQVSYNETFNIVAADFVVNNIPVVVSKEINWVNSIFYADPNDIGDIINKLDLVYYGKMIRIQALNKGGLRSYNKHSLENWLNYLD